MIAYIRRIKDAYQLTDEETERQEKGRRLWVLFDEAGLDIKVGDCVDCYAYAMDRDITILSLH